MHNDLSFELERNKVVNESGHELINSLLDCSILAIG